jgi:hypothetical protein
MGESLPVTHRSLLPHVADAAAEISQAGNHEGIARLDTADDLLQRRTRRGRDGIAAVIDEHGSHIDEKARCVDLDQVTFPNVLMAAGVYIDE